MKKWRRFTAAGLSAAMVLSLAACGTSDKGGTEKKVELTPPGTYPVVKDGEKLEMSVFTMSMPNVKNLATNDFTKFLEKKTGIKINFQTGGRDDWSDKLNLELQSGDYPDIILGVSPNMAKYAVKEGVFLKLDDMINKDNCPNYLKLLGDHLDLQRQPDGHIYSLSGINDCYHCSYGQKMWINKKYLEQMGVPVPATTQEFYDVCKKFKAFKPDGIAIGGTAQGKGWFSTFQGFLMGSFLLSPPSSPVLNVQDDVVVTRDGKAVCAATDDRYKKFMEYLNSLYKIGAIYDGDFTQTQEQFKTVINQTDEPVLCFPEGTISDYIDSASNNKLYRDYEPMSPLKGPDGTRLSTHFKYDAFGYDSFEISTKCKNPEAALRWIDFFFSPTGDLSSQYGADEGKDWALNPPGEVGLNGKPAMYKILNPYSPDTQNHDWQDIGIRVAPADYRLGQATNPNVDPYSPDGLERLLYEATKNLYEPYGQDVQKSDLDILPPLKFTDAESSDVSTIAVEVSKAINETSVAFITGSKKVDTDWDTFKKDLDKAGLKKLLAAYQKAYDRQIKGSGTAK